MRFGQAHFPWQTRIFDRGRRGRARAAVVTRDQDDVCLGLGHTRRNRADTRGRTSFTVTLQRGLICLRS